MKERARFQARKGFLLAVSAAIITVACGDNNNPTISEEDDWGVGAKADGDQCAAESDLCWTSQDSTTMGQALALETDVAMDRVAYQQGLTDLVDFIWLLGHKLTVEERAALTEYEAAIDALGPNATYEDAVARLTELREMGFHRLIAAFDTAHMIPVGRAADYMTEGKADELTEIEEGEAEATEPDYTQGMIESLQMLRDAGVLGRAYATMLETSGVLEADYDVIDAAAFGALDTETGEIHPLGRSRESRVDEIIGDYTLAASFVGAVAGAEALIPVVGVPLSIATETYALFRLHARMVFEIAAVHGLDLREGRNLLTITLILINDGLGAESIDMLASNMVVPLFARAVARRMNMELPADMDVRVASRSLSAFVRYLYRESQRTMTDAAVNAGTQGVGRQLLGWATLGLAIAISAGVDYYATGILGRRSAVASRLWLHDLLLEGTTFLRHPEARSCMFQAVGAMAWADGEVCEREQALYQAILAKPFYADEQSYFHLDSAERVLQSQALRGLETDADAQDDALSCVEDVFEDAQPQHKLSVLSYIYSMAQVDMEESESERSFYQSMRNTLDGQGLFDGAAIDEEQLDYVERAIYLLLHPGTAEVAPEYEAAMNALQPEETVDFLAHPAPAVVADFDCGFNGNCR